MAAAEYEKWKLAENADWELFLHAYDQQYLGRAYVWLKQEGNMQRYTSLSQTALLSLNVIMQLYECILDELWEPDHINYAWLGNDIHLHNGHGHMHIVPRYKKPRTFMGYQFVDQNWGANYAPHKHFALPYDVVRRMRDILCEEIGYEVRQNPSSFASVKVAE